MKTLVHVDARESLRGSARPACRGGLREVGNIMIARIITVLIAVLVATSATAQTSATKTELPDTMMGAWCGQKDYQFPNDDAAEHRRRAEDMGVEDARDCGNRGGLYVRKDGYDYYRFGPRGSCEYVAIEFSRYGEPTDHVKPVGPPWEVDFPAVIADAPPSDVYWVHATCKGATESWDETYETQTTDGWLIRWFLDEG